MGRPKGSKNKVNRHTGPTLVSIGLGTQWVFPIVRDGNTRTKVMMLSVGSETFVEALKSAIQWALAYSEENGAVFWPLVRIKSELVPLTMYAKRIDHNSAWVEDSDYGYWTHTGLLEAI